MARVRGGRLKRATVRRTVRYSGVDRNGLPAAVQLGPGWAGSGIRFNGVVAKPGTAHVVRHSTNVGGIGLVEHLLAACHLFGVTDLVVRCSGRELPMGDGSSLTYARLLQRAGVRKLEGNVKPVRLESPVMTQRGSSIAAALPARKTTLTCFVPLEHLGERRCSVTLGTGNRSTGASVRRRLLRYLIPARTFGVVVSRGHSVLSGYSQNAPLGQLRRRLHLRFRLARMGRTIVPARWRFPDEPWRHKVLDLVGDLWLLGRPLAAEVFLVRPNHRFNLAFVRMLEQAQEVS